MANRKMSKSKGVTTHKPTGRETYGRTAKKSQPDDLPGHAQSSRARPDLGSMVKRRLKGVLI